MRVLLANHHMQSRCGSELYVQELALGLRSVGHEVSLFTFYPGAISDTLKERGVRVLQPGDDERIVAFDPEVLHTHHAPTLYYLGALPLSCPVVHSVLGTSPPLEAPPLTWGGVGATLGVSDEVIAHLRQTRFGQSMPLRLFRNWFDDRGLRLPVAPRVRRVRHLAVVTNHLDETIHADLFALQARHPDFSWKHFGMPDNVAVISPELLVRYDAVMTIGRTALLAAALGKPCLLYDVYGSDGWLTPEHFEAQDLRNLSGRAFAQKPGADGLARLLFEDVGQVDVVAVAMRVFAGYRLTDRVRELTSLYESLRAQGPRLGPPVWPAYGAEGKVYADATTLVLERNEELVELHRKVALLEAELARARTR